MKRFTDAGRRAIADANLYAGLSMALMLPDICGSIETPNDGPTKRYIRWCRKWVEPKFTVTMGHPPAPHVFLSSEDLYQMRCSVIHEGSADIALAKQTKLQRFLFFDKAAGAHLTRFDDCLIDGVKQSLLQLKVDLFSEELFKAADEWAEATTKDPQIQAEMAKLLTIHSSGYILGGIRFG